VYSLEDLGWCEYFSSQYETSKTGSDFVPARVTEDNREIYRILSATGEFLSELVIAASASASASNSR